VTLSDVLLRRILTAAIALAVAVLPEAPASAEQLPQPMWVLARSPFQLEVTVLSVELKKQDARTTNVWHRVRVERVIAGSGLKAGDETAVVSQIFDNPPGTIGSSGDRGPFTGPRGLPAKGDRARIFADGSVKVLKTVPPNGWQKLERTISFIAADDEYRSEITMPFLAKLVGDAGVASTRLHFATGDDGTGSSAKTPDVDGRTGLTDDWSLRGSDASVLYMRFRELGYNQMLAFEAATTHGLPLVGFRTSTHAFRYPGDDDGAKRWNDAFPIETWGTNWKFHHGHSSKTRILPPEAEAAKHPVLAGVTIPHDGLVVSSWLYQVEPLPDNCRVLLWGEALDSERPDAPQKQPVLWVRERPRKEGLPMQRIAFTTLGHPGEFANAEFRLIAVQMVAWALDEMKAIDDQDRAAIRAAAFEAPPTR
jgi:hypothetical protein